MTIPKTQTRSTPAFLTLFFGSVDLRNFEPAFSLLCIDTGALNKRVFHGGMVGYQDKERA